MKKIKYLILLVLGTILLPLSADAATGTISVTGSSTVVVGNTVTVTVTLSSSTAIGSWEMDLNYDSNYLKLVSSTGEAGGTGMVNSSSGVKSKTYTFKFTALKSGSTKVSVGSYLAYAYADESELDLTASSKTIKIMTQAELEATYSTDNYLKALTVSVDGVEYELDTEFSKDTTEYSVTVPTGTTSVTVSATKNDSTASVSGDGEIEVSEGTNSIPITVTAQNGDVKTYTLTVNVEDQNPITVTIDGVEYTVVKNESLLEVPLTFTATTVSISGFDIPAFINTQAGITLVGLKDASGNIALYIYEDGVYTKYSTLSSNTLLLLPMDITENLDYIVTTVMINNESFVAYKYTEDTDFAIIKAMNLETGEEDYYLYDTVNGTAVRWDDSYIKEANSTIENYTYVIIALASASGLMLLIVFILLHSLKKKQKKINKFIEKQEAKLAATTKLNNVIDEVKKLDEQPKVQEETKKLEEPKEEVKLSKKELKKLKKEEHKKPQEEPKDKPEETVKEDTKPKDTPQEEVEEETTYDIFGDDKKKKKKKHE